MFSSEEKEIGRFSVMLWGGLILVLLVGSGIAFVANRTVRTVDNAFIHYEDFQEMYNSCKAIDGKLCAIKQVDEKDKMFDQISKAAQITGLKNNMNRWVEEYNAKSRMWNRSLWKSSNLPYELTTSQFPCYEGSK